MKEYERSFKVKDIAPFVNYCKQNGYKDFGATSQNRIVYESQICNHIIARITTDIVNGKKKTVFDCKNIGKRNKNLKISNESIPLLLNSKSLKAITSILEVLEFKLSANNFRTRYVFEKDNVKFEIDDYSHPRMNVVAVEGDENLVEQVCKQITTKFCDYLLPPD